MTIPTAVGDTGLASSRNSVPAVWARSTLIRCSITHHDMSKKQQQQIERALVADLADVASSKASKINLTVFLLNGDDVALSVPRDATASEVRAQVAQAMRAKSARHTA